MKKINKKKITKEKVKQQPKGLMIKGAEQFMGCTMCFAYKFCDDKRFKNGFLFTKEHFASMIKHYTYSDFEQALDFYSCYLYDFKLNSKINGKMVYAIVNNIYKIYNKLYCEINNGDTFMFELEKLIIMRDQILDSLVELYKNVDYNKVFENIIENQFKNELPKGYKLPKIIY